jgi:hypothetical protein
MSPKTRCVFAIFDVHVRILHLSDHRVYTACLIIAIMFLSFFDDDDDDDDEDVCVFLCSRRKKSAN